MAISRKEHLRMFLQALAIGVIVFLIVWFSMWQGGML